MFNILNNDNISFPFQDENKKRLDAYANNMFGTFVNKIENEIENANDLEYLESKLEATEIDLKRIVNEVFRAPVFFSSFSK